MSICETQAWTAQSEGCLLHDYQIGTPLAFALKQDGQLDDPYGLPPVTGSYIMPNYYILL